MNFYNDIEKEILALYEQIGVGESDVCLKCRETCSLSMPICCWCVGNHFYDNEQRVLFVGKNARGNPGNIHKSFRNTFEVTRSRLWNKNWAYWSYTREISKRLYGDDSPEHIAFTNIVKCNDSPDIDTTSYTVKYNCIQELMILRKEIEIINPTHIIFYTSWDYDDFISRIFDFFGVDCDETKKVGAKSMPWLTASTLVNGKEIKVLRIGHPERKKKEDFVNSVVEWVKVNSDL